MQRRPKKRAKFPVKQAVRLAPPLEIAAVLGSMVDPTGTKQRLVSSHLNRAGWMNMNDIAVEVAPSASEVSDLRGLSLAELAAVPTIDAIVARVVHDVSKAPSSRFAVGAFNSYI